VPFNGAALPTHTEPTVVSPVLLITLACLSTALLTRRFYPAATLFATVATGGIVLLAGAIGTSTELALFVVVALFALSWLLGEVLLPPRPFSSQVSLVRIPIAIGLGSGLLGLLLLGLVTLGALNTATVVGGTAVILLVGLLLAGARLRVAVTGLCAWRPAALSWLETVFLGLTIGLVAYAALAAFVPEVHSDAVRQHLPIAREIWQTGGAPEFEVLTNSRFPIHAHLLYAVAYGFGGMTAAKLVHTFTGLVAMLGIAGICWLVSGRTAATVGVAIFATMPLVLWELGMALVDLFPVLFTVTALLSIVLWQRGGSLAWLISAGALAGFGFAAKMTMGVMIVAIGLALVIVGRGAWSWRERFEAGMAFGLGLLVLVPWLLRSYVITGEVPGVTILTGHALGTATSDLSLFGLGRSPLDLLRIPWHLTFHGEVFHREGAGDVGILLLMTLPLVLLAPRTRITALLALAAGFSYFGWAFTAQLTRYLLPTLALTAALAGIGVASVIMASVRTATVSRLRRLLVAVVPVSLVVGLLLAAPLLFLGKKLGLPVDLNIITGEETVAEYVAENIPAAAPLAAASAMLPPDTEVGYIGRWEGAQIYTEARLTYFDSQPLGTSPEEILARIKKLGTTPEGVLASLDRLGLYYFIWQRTTSRPEAWRSTLLSTEFLRNHTRILAGDRSGYLFEVLPARGEGWGEGEQNLLSDPGLNTVGDDGPWATEGKVSARKGIVSLLRRDSSLAQRVPVSAGGAYLLLATGKCDGSTDTPMLVLRWFDARGDEIGAAAESVIPGTAASTQFLWHVAPERAVSVSAEVASSGARCEFDEAALYGPS